MTEQQLSSEKQTVIPTPPKDTKCVNIHLLQSTSQLHNLKWFGLAIEGRLSIKELMAPGQHIMTKSLFLIEGNEFQAKTLISY